MEATSDHSLVKTVASWILLVGLSGAIYWRIQNDPKKKATVTRTVTQAKQELGNDVASATAAMKKKADKALSKPKPKPASSRPEAAAPGTTAEYDPAAEAAARRDEAKANQDFAQSFNKLQTGHHFTANKTEKKRQKSVKQSRAQETDAPAASPPSSAAGDADDDLSSAASPIAAPVDNSGVSDMLEAVSPGPSVLRLTDTDKAPQAVKKAKVEAAVETKKQRQNRLKAERKKEEREQDETERKKLEEAQRRRARIAEGRPAKDGSSFVTNKDNAWTAKTNGDSSAPVQLLDTFEKPVEAPAAASTPKANVAGNKERSESWMSTLPSEEDQIAQVMEDSSAWSEVTTKKTKKGKKTQESAPETIQAPTSATPVQASAPAAQSAVNGSKSKPALSSHSSFAALAPEETADDDEVEEEWEV